VQIETRIAELESELRAGRAMLDDLDARKSTLKSQMLRVSGAIRVLHELLEEDTPEPEARRAAVG
jgi:hypothetical protein